MTLLRIFQSNWVADLHQTITSYSILLVPHLLCCRYKSQNNNSLHVNYGNKLIHMEQTIEQQQSLLSDRVDTSKRSFRGIHVIAYLKRSCKETYAIV